MSQVAPGLRRWIGHPWRRVFACLALGLAMAACSIVTSVISALFLRPLQVPHPEDLLDVVSTGPGLRVTPLIMKATEYLELEDHIDRTRLEGVAAAAPLVDAVVRGAGGSHAMLGEVVSENYFRVLRPDVQLGAADGRDDAAVAISARAWHQLFGADRHVVGRPLVVNGVPFKVSAIMAPGFRGIVFAASYEPDFWVSLRAGLLVRMDALDVVTKARAAPNVHPANAIAALDSALGFFNERALVGRGMRVFARPGALASLPPGIEVWAQGAATSCGAVAVGLLAIACVNVAMVLLAFGMDRRVDTATKVALGARWATTVRESLADAVTITTIAAVMATGLCGIAGWMISRQAPEIARGVTVAVTAGVDGVVVLTVAVIVVVVTIACALLPSRRLTSLAAARVLVDGGISVTRRRKGLGIEDVTLLAHMIASVVLLCLAVELGGSFARQRVADRGFQAEGVAFARLRPLDSVRAVSVVDRILETLRSDAGVEVSAVTKALPFESENRCRRLAVGSVSHVACRQGVGPGYFETVRTGVLLGEVSPPPSSQEHVIPVAVNVAATKTFWPNQSPLGAVFQYDGRSMQVTALVEDVDFGGSAGLTMPTIYAPVSEADAADVILIARGRTGTRDALQALQRIGRAFAPDALVTEPESYAARIERGPLYPLRLSAALGAAVAAVAMFISTCGLFSSLACSTTRRTREFAVRSSVGAPPWSLIGSAIGRELLLVATALGTGLWLAWQVSRVLSVQVSRFFVFEWATGLSVVAVVVVLAGIASLLPAGRVLRTAPASVLRD